MAKPDVDAGELLSAGHLREWFADPAALLKFQQQPLEAIKNDCIFILDANVLLLPYASSSKPFAEISKLFENLVGQKRLFVPAQAMREFLGLRAKKLGEIAKQLTDYQSQLSIPALPRVPLLADDPNYIRALTETKKASDLATAKQAVGVIVESLKGPIGTDPVSISYQKLFGDVLLEETDEHFNEAVAQLKVRYSQKRPPGFNDAGKPDGGIGDLLIWRSILRLASASKLHCVFVSSDRKSDWWVQANGAFQPRLELVEEYRAASGGKTLHLALLGDALELVGASPNTVDEVRALETPPLSPSEISRIVSQAQRLQLESSPARSPSFYREKALALERKIALGEGREGDEASADRFISIAHHVEGRSKAAAEELAIIEGNLASHGMGFARDPDTKLIIGISW